MTTIESARLQNQLSPLPGASVTITTHDNNGNSTVYQGDPEVLRKWHPPLDDANMAFFTPFSTHIFPSNPSNDLELHMAAALKSAQGGPPISLVIPSGTVCRMVDFAPGYTTVSH